MELRVEIAESHAHCFKRVSVAFWPENTQREGV